MRLRRADRVRVVTSARLADMIELNRTRSAALRLWQLGLRRADRVRVVTSARLADMIELNRTRSAALRLCQLGLRRADRARVVTSAQLACDRIESHTPQSCCHHYNTK